MDCCDFDVAAMLQLFTSHKRVLTMRSDLNETHRAVSLHIRPRLTCRAVAAVNIHRAIIDCEPVVLG